MSKVFVSYRRQDTQASTGRIVRALRNAQIFDHVFFDKDDIGLGADFSDEIEAAVAASDFILVMIGPRWLKVQDERYRRARLFAPGDVVRCEIEAALRDHKFIIPILLGGTKMPRISDVPESIAALCERNAIEIRRLTWKRSVCKLTSALAAAQQRMREREIQRERESADMFSSLRTIQSDPQTPSIYLRELGLGYAIKYSPLHDSPPWSPNNPLFTDARAERRSTGHVAIAEPRTSDSKFRRISRWLIKIFFRA